MMPNPEAGIVQETEAMIKRLFKVAEILSRGTSDYDSRKNPPQNPRKNNDLENLRYCEEHSNLNDI